MGPFDHRQTSPQHPANHLKIGDEFSDEHDDDLVGLVTNFFLHSEWTKLEHDKNGKECDLHVG